MNKKKFREVAVKSSTRITPNMQRVILTGTALSDFPADSDSGYIKLLFNHDHTPVTDEAALATLDGQRPVMRTYTIRSFDPESLALTVDFVLHGSDGHSGPASGWARTCKAGDRILIGGPGPVKLIDPNAEWFFIAGDMTALPAISCNLEQMPADARGVAIIAVEHEDDQQDLIKPAGMDVIWVTSHEQLLARAHSVDWPKSDVAAWCACEFSSMRQMRQFLKIQKEVARNKLYVSSYWKQGHSEEEHKVVKRADAETELA